MLSSEISLAALRGMTPAATSYRANIMPIDPLPPLRGRGRTVNIHFFQNMVMLHTKLKGKGKDECSNMHAYILSLQAPSTPRVGSNIFLKVVLLHILIEGSFKHHASTYFVLTTLRPLWWGQNIFTENSHVAYHIKREWNKEHHISTYSVLTHTLYFQIGSKVQNIYFTESSNLHTNLKGMDHSNMQAHILSLRTHLAPGWSKTFFPESSYVAYKVAMLHIKLKPMEHRAS